MRRSGTVDDLIKSALSDKIRRMVPFAKAALSVLSQTVPCAYDGGAVLRSRATILHTFADLLDEAAKTVTGSQRYAALADTPSASLIKAGLRCTLTGQTAWIFSSPKTSFKLVVESYDLRVFYEGEGPDPDLLYLEAWTKVSDAGFKIHPEPKDGMGKPVVVGVNAAKEAIRL